MKDYFRKSKPVHFVFPIDGDCVNSADGTREGNDLIVKVKIAAPENAELYVNDVKAVKNGDVYEVDVRFESYRTSLTAVDTVSGESDTIAVFKFKAPEKKFRLSVDDNILFLRDIAKNQDKYVSLFDNPYLKAYKRAHDETGVCVHMNLFFETGADTTAPDYFNLTMMPDKYKAEWEANSNWLRLSFHSRTNEPLWPYKNTTHSKITEDCKLVNKEIIRFAGEKTLAKTTTLHFGATNPTGVRALRTLGYQTLAAYFEFDSEGNTMVSYYYPKDLVSYTYKIAQGLFLRGQGVFHVNGDWFENEMKDDKAEIKAKENIDYSIKLMRTPIVSALGTKLGITDAQLAATVDYVDGVTSEAPAGVGEDKIAVVREARGVVHSIGANHTSFVPS